MGQIFTLSLQMGLIIFFLAFIAEYVDSTLGMGYGTSLTPILLLFGFSPLQIVPAVLLSELVTGLLAGFTHHSLGNADFKPKTLHPVKIFRSIREMGLSETYKQGVPLHLRIVMLISACSILGTVLAVILAVNLPGLYVKIYIGVLILGIGIFLLVRKNRNMPFSWKKITGLGLLASFNKGISGGGYGPVVTGGQILSGVDGKNAIAITSLAEGITCLVGVITYLLTNTVIDWSLCPYLLIGAIISVPLSGITIKAVKTSGLKVAIGVLTTGLGIFTLWKVIDSIVVSM